MSDEIRATRRHLGLNQQSFAKMLGISQQTLSLLEQGKRKPTNRIKKSLAMYGNRINTPQNGLKYSKCGKVPLKTKELQCPEIEHFQGLGRREFESWWWEKFYWKCQQCARECKQSSRVEVLSCPQFQNRT